MNEMIWTPPGDANAERVGGKAASLARLAQAGHDVPPFFVVTTAAFESFLTSSPLLREIRLELARLANDTVASIANEIQQAIRSTTIPEGLRAAILEQHTQSIGNDYAAVRSSAIGEDASEHSFAGLHESFLFVRGEEAILDSVRIVWASAFNERALTYRLAAAGSLDLISIAVVVQKMIDPRSSGVAFTANPITESVHEVLINALWGTGEGLVSHGFDADSYTVDKDSLEVAKEIVPKREAIVHRGTEGVEQISIGEPQASTPSLSDEEARSVARTAIAIEQYFGRPQDIEFAFDSFGRLYILQSRAVTTAKEFGPAAGNRLLWDNSNIIESFSGVTSPMTFSVIRRAYTIVYRCFAEVMGIDPQLVHENRFVFENMLGLFRGQVYYNLLNWYRVVRLFPGFEYNRAFMESMMGVKESVSVDAPARTRAQKYFVDLPALLKLLGNSSFNFLRIRSLVSEFEQNFRHHYTRWDALDLDALKPHELMQLYLDFEEKVLWSWRPPIINDFFVMIFYGVLKKLCASWCGDESGSLQNDLISGEGGIESTEPAKQLLRLAKIARSDARLKELIETAEPAEALAQIRRDPAFADFNGHIDHYLDLYGFRCMNELKLEELSLRDKPEFVLSLLRNYVSGDEARLDLHAQELREREIRREAERKAFSRISSPVKRAIFERVLANARLGVKNRENMRFARTRIFGLVREVLRAIGRQFEAEKIIERADDIFYLTLDEVFDFIKGTAVTTNLRALVALRRAEFDDYRAAEPPDDRFETFGIAYHRNRFAARRTAPVSSEPGLLRGTPCSPGRITNVVKIVRSPADDIRLSGEILIAERTDPGWVPLYPSVSGILIERGSILSHSAIVAREMGIPTIVGIPNLTRTLQSGQRVTMDGSTGEVRVEE